MNSGRSSELRKGNGVIAPEHYRDDACAVYGLESFRYPPVALLYVAGHYGHVAVVYDREVVEDGYILRRVVGSKQMRDTTYPFRTEACTNAEGRSRIEGSAKDGDISIL